MKVKAIFLFILIGLFFSAQNAEANQWGIYFDYIPFASNTGIRQLNTFAKNNGGTAIPSVTGYSFGIVISEEAWEDAIAYTNTSGKGTVIKQSATSPSSFSYSSGSVDFIFTRELTSIHGNPGLFDLQLFLPLEISIGVMSSTFLSDAPPTKSLSLPLSTGLKLRTYFSENFAVDITALGHLDPFGGTNSAGWTNSAGTQSVAPSMTGWDIRAGLVYVF